MAAHCAIAVAFLAAIALEAVAQSRSGAPDARAILDSVIDALPDVPLRLDGELIARGAGREREQRQLVELLFDWQADPPSARFTVRDAFGAPLRHLAVTWPDRVRARFNYFEGYPLRAMPPPDPTANIPGTDLSWMDLSLLFLWWPNPQLAGVEDVRGQSCWVIDVPAPADMPAVSGVRVWVARRAPIVLKAESYDPSHRAVRRFEVKSFKRINNRWVIKDVEVQNLLTRTRTTLRIRQVQDMRRHVLSRDDSADSETVENGEEDHSAEDSEIPPVEPVPGMSAP